VCICLYDDVPLNHYCRYWLCCGRKCLQPWPSYPGNVLIPIYCKCFLYAIYRINYHRYHLHSERDLHNYSSDSRPSSHLEYHDYNVRLFLLPTFISYAKSSRLKTVTVETIITTTTSLFPAPIKRDLQPRSVFVPYFLTQFSLYAISSGCSCFVSPLPAPTTVTVVEVLSPVFISVTVRISFPSKPQC
jgi:hypothetical protein